MYLIVARHLIQEPCGSPFCFPCGMGIYIHCGTHVTDYYKKRNGVVMKTLILNGSPRINGDTSSLIKKFTEKKIDEYKIVDAYRCNISACLDCRNCWKNNGCSINDEMQEIYKYIQECDNILIASPLYFSELTGKLLDVGSRLQTYFCARFFRNEEPIAKLGNCETSAKLDAQ